jgi:hypothetical protein
MYTFQYKRESEMKRIINDFISTFITVFFVIVLGGITYLRSFNNEFANSLQEAGFLGLAALFIACVSIVLLFTLVKINGGFKTKRIFPDTTKMDKYFAKRVAEAKKEVCSLMWQDDTIENVPFTHDRRERQDTMKTAISAFCGKGHTYKEVFTFSFTKRFDIMEERLELGSNYQCRYYDNLALELKDRFPKLQFRIIDDEEVIFASKKYVGAICAIKDRKLAKIMKVYFELAWGNALEISNSDPKKQIENVDKLRDQLKGYEE